MKSFGMSLFYICVITLYLIISPCLNTSFRAEDNSKNKNPNYKIYNTCKDGDCAKDQSTISFQNSNLNNGGGYGPFGKTAQIVNPSITFHSESTVNSVKQTPAQVGWRHETHKVTKLNKVTGKLTKKTIKKKVPIKGNVQTITPLKARHTRKYDLNSHTFGQTKTTISEH